MKINHTLNNADIKISTSTDGLNWSSKVTLTQSGDKRYIEPYLYYLNNEFVIVEGGDGNSNFNEIDGLNGFQSVAFDGNRFIGIKFDGTIYTKNAAYTGSWEQAGTLPEAGRRAGVGIYYTGK